MEYNCSVCDDGWEWCSGRIVIEDNVCIVYKKSIFILLLFGAIVNALTKGKECFRFDKNDVKSFEYEKTRFRNRLTITFNNEDILLLDVKDDALYEISKTLGYTL